MHNANLHTSAVLAALLLRLTGPQSAEWNQNWMPAITTGLLPHRAL